MASNVKEQGNVNYPVGKLEVGKEAPEDELKQPIIHASTSALQPILKNPNVPKYSGSALASASQQPKKEA